MLRRHFISGLGSLAVLAVGGSIAGAGVARAGGHSGPETDAASGLPAALGGLQRSDVRRGPSMITTTYSGPNAQAEISVAQAAGRVPDGGDTPVCPATLRQLHEATIAAARRDKIAIELVRENTPMRAGMEGHDWTWLANVYALRSAQADLTRRVLLVTGHRERIVVAMLDIAASSDVDLNPLMNELSALLASARAPLDQDTAFRA